MNRILHLTEPGAIGGKSKTFYGSHLLLPCINKTSGTFILSYFNIWGEGVNVVSEFKFEVHNIFNLRTGSIFWWLDMTFSMRWALIWKVQKSPEYSTNTFESSFQVAYIGRKVDNLNNICKSGGFNLFLKNQDWKI